MRKSLTLGLLGGIGSGKSTVAALLGRLGAVVLDADQYVRELLQDPEVRREMLTAFGENVFHPDGRVDKTRLADRIFTHESDRKSINAIIHPRVRKRIKEELTALRGGASKKIIVLDIPLLLGSELESLCDLLVMVRSSETSRLERVRSVRGWDKGELKRREACQATIKEKETAAHAAIDNDGTIKELEDKIISFYENLL